MTAITGPGRDVLERFVEGANAQYRAAGLAEHQIKLDRRGQLVLPGASRTRFRTPSASGSAAPEQASASAAAIRRSGAAPAVSDLKQRGTDEFQLAWKPVQGAARYGIWQDGKLMGHVTDPSFAGKVASGTSNVLQVDAVRADGTRTALTKPLKVTQGPSGLAFDAG